MQQSEILSWLDNPVTIRIQKKLEQLLDAEEKALISGAYLSNHDKTSYAIGFMAGLREFLDTKPEDVYEDSKTRGTQSSY